MVTTHHNKRDKWWAAVIGSGIAIAPINNLWLHETLFTNSRGELVFLLPWLGYLLIIFGSWMFLLHNWDRVLSVGWGSWKVVGALGMVVLAMAASGTAYSGVKDTAAPALMGLSLASLYLTSRVLGRKVFVPLAVGAAVASGGVFVSQVLNPGQPTGGLVFGYNYNLVVGYVLFGSLLFVHRRQWVLVGLAIPALVATGSPEAVLPLMVIGVVMVVRRDWGRKLLLVALPAVAVIALLFATGHGQTLVEYPLKIVKGESTVRSGEEYYSAIGYRWHVIQEQLDDLPVLGTGYSLDVRSTSIHNTPAIMIHQMGYPGALAALAWLYLCVYGAVATQWRYAWLAMLALSVFDNFTWAQLGTVWWALLGASTAPENVGSDLVFRDA